MSADDVIASFQKMSNPTVEAGSSALAQEYRGHKGSMDTVPNSAEISSKKIETNPEEGLSKVDRVIEDWQKRTRKPESQEHYESLSPEEFKSAFMKRMGTMDIGERTDLEKFIFGNNAKEANTAQSFMRGIRGELSSTGLGIKQRYEDLTGASDEETVKLNELMRQQIGQQKRTNHPIATGAGEIAGTVVEFAPVAATGAGAVPLLATGAGYGFTRPQEEGYTANDIAAKTGTEAIISLVGGKAAQKALDIASPFLTRTYTRLTGRSPVGTLINNRGEPSEELLEALESQGLKYDDLLEDTGVLNEMKKALESQPVGADAEQAVRAARYEALGITPTKPSLTQGFDEAVEAQTLRRQINDPEAATLREVLAEESQGFTRRLDDMASSIGNKESTEIGETVRNALASRKAEQRTLKNEAYTRLANEAELVGESLPVGVEDLAKVWSTTKKIKRSQMTGLHSDIKESLMRFGVVEADDSFGKLVARGEESITPLSVKNFESLRQELNANINPQDPSTSAILKPLIRQLDESIETTANNTQGAAQLTALSKEARNSARNFKAEFNSKDMVDNILATKRGTFETYNIRATDVFNKLIKTSRKTSTIEPLDEVLTSLEKGGAKGRVAISDLQSATVMELLKEATSQVGAKGVKGQQFSYTAFVKAIEGIGEKEMKRLFSNNPDTLNSLNQLKLAAKDSQTFFDAIPKGSANDMQNTFARAFSSIFHGVGFAKGGSLGQIAAVAMTEKASQSLSKRKLRYAISNQIRSTPSLRPELTKLSKQYPGIVEAIGIAALTKEVDSLKQ